MQTQKIKLSELEPNLGQIDGLPINPRQWTKSDVDKIAKSLQETPELFDARPLLVIPHAGKYVILGGNLRFEGCKQNKAKDAPCYVFPEDTPIDKLKEIVIKDNGAFGAWDFDMLANEWDNMPLTDWGVPAWSMPKTEQLPPELDGVDLNPDELVKMEGDDETATERLYICYKKQDEAKLVAFLGMEGESFDGRVVYTFDGVTLK